MSFDRLLFDGNRRFPDYKKTTWSDFEFWFEMRSNDSWNWILNLTATRRFAEKHLDSWRRQRTGRLGAVAGWTIRRWTPACTLVLALHEMTHCLQDALTKPLLSKCLSVKCLLAKCLSAKCVLAKCLSVKCLSAKCLLAKCLLGKCLLAKCFSAKRQGTKLTNSRNQKWHMAAK